jgi:hypothetical protein
LAIAASVLLVMWLNCLSYADVKVPPGDTKITESKREQKVLKMIELKCLEMKEMMLAQG